MAVDERENLTEMAEMAELRHCLQSLPAKIEMLSMGLAFVLYAFGQSELGTAVWLAGTFGAFLNA